MANLLFVHDDPTPTAADNTLVSLLETAGHTVTLQSEVAAPPTSGYDAIVISESGSSGSVAQWEDNPLPVTCLEVGAFSALGLTSASTSTAGSGVWDLQPHDITSGFADPLTGSSGGGSYGVDTSTLSGGTSAVAVEDGTTHCILFACEAGGAIFTASTTAPNRRACFGISNGSVSGLTTDGQDLFVAMVEWSADSGASSGSASGAHAWAGSAAGSNLLPPTGLSATPVAADRIDLSWNAASSATGYDIERDSVVIVTDHATTSYSDMGLDPDTEYTYRVRSVQ